MANRYRVEAWSLPLATSTKLVNAVPFITGQTQDELNAAGRGQITVRADYDRLDEIESALFRVYQNGTLRGDLSFFGRRQAKDLRSESEGVVTISGPGIGDIMNWARVENFDYPVQPTVEPDWNWGSGNNVSGFRNAGFEQSQEIPGAAVPGEFDTATGFEDQTLQGWEAIPAGGDFRASDTAPTVTNAEAFAGTYSLSFDGATRHSGIRKKITFHGGETYELTVKLKSATTGKRFTFAMQKPSGATVSHTNAFTYNGLAMAELGNVASTGTGLPGGSTDGTWQSMNIKMTMPTFDNESNTADLWIYVQYDHHDASNGPVAYVDGFTVTGPAGVGPTGLGLKPWYPGGLATTFIQDSTGPTPLEGLVALKYDATTTGGPYQLIEGITPGRTLTFCAWVYHESGVGEDFTIQILGTSGALIAENTDSVPTATWTEVCVTTQVDVTSIFVKFKRDDGGIFWADDTRLYFGMQPASWGDILIQLLDDATTDHTGEAGALARDTLGFLDYTGFSATLDSGGNAWLPALLEYRAKRGKKYKQILSDGERWGFEWKITDTLTGPVLNVYNPYVWATRTGGIGTSRPGTGVPTIRYGNGIVSGPIVKQSATMNRVHVEGEDGLWDVRRDATAIAAYDTREGYEGDRNLLSVDGIGEIADQFIDERTIPTTALKININPQDNPDVATPYDDFNIGDTYPLDLAGDFTGNKRVVKITTDFTPGHGAYTVEFDNTSYTSDPLKAIAEGVRRLLEKFDELDQPPDLSTGGPTVFDGDPILDPTFVVAASNARDAVKEQADYICDGIADEEEIQSALDAVEDLTAAQGRVQLSEGTFNLSSNAQVDVPIDVTLQGVGVLSTSVTFFAIPEPGQVFSLAAGAQLTQFEIYKRGTC